MLIPNRKDLIVVTCDFTEPAKAALQHASRIAAESEDEVRLLHVINTETKSKLKKAKASENQIYMDLEKWAAENQKEYGITTSYHAQEGSIFTTIGEYLTESDASLLVMGTHGVRGIQHVVGAYAMKVISSSPVPVLVVQRRRPEAGGYKKIVLPIDHYRHGKNKTAYAILTARYFDGEVHIFESRESDAYLANHIKLNAAHARQYLEQNGVRYVEAREQAGEGSFTKQLLRYASSVKADMIVITSHQASQGMADLIVGSNEVQIINNEDEIPVMCVNPIQDTGHLGVFG